jgi:hypothetical protein
LAAAAPFQPPPSWPRRTAAAATRSAMIATCVRHARNSLRDTRCHVRRKVCARRVSAAVVRRSSEKVATSMFMNKCCSAACSIQSLWGEPSAPPQLHVMSASCVPSANHNNRSSQAPRVRAFRLCFGHVLRCMWPVCEHLCNHGIWQR